MVQSGKIELFGQENNELNKDKFFMAASATVIAVASAAAPISAASTHPFTDVGAQYEEAVSFLFENEILSGKTSTQFGTQQALTRGDAAVIMARTLGVDTELAPDAGFTDLNDRVRGSVNGLAELGIVAGVTDTQFKPNDPLTRGAMAKFLVLGFGLEEEEESETPFTDVGGVFTPFINSLYGLGITNGKTETSYGTYLNITRGEFANLLYKTISYIIDNIYFFEIERAEVTSSTSFQIVAKKEVPAEFTPRDLGYYFFYSARLDDGTVIDFTPNSFQLSPDRKTFVINHKNDDMAGKKGVIVIDDFESTVEIPFDFTVPEMTAGEGIQVTEDIQTIFSVPTTLERKE